MAKFDGMSQVRGKCQYWRERANEDDRWDVTVKAKDRRVGCSCFIEGDAWEVTVVTVPEDCPKAHRCRYYIEAS